MPADYQDPVYGMFTGNLSHTPVVARHKRNPERPGQPVGLLTLGVAS